MTLLLGDHVLYVLSKFCGSVHIRWFTLWARLTFCPQGEGKTVHIGKGLLSVKYECAHYTPWQPCIFQLLMEALDLNVVVGKASRLPRIHKLLVNAPCNHFNLFSLTFASECCSDHTGIQQHSKMFDVAQTSVIWYKSPCQRQGRLCTDVADHARLL